MRRRRPAARARWPFAILALSASLLIWWVLRRAARTTPETVDPARLVAALDRCELVKRLLNGEHTADLAVSREGLPSAGKPTPFGAVFWLKQPVLRFDAEGGRGVLLKYNKYLPTQHTEKWTNTVGTLATFAGRTAIFPKLLGHCRDPGDGFHYVVAEWIDLHPQELAPPAKFAECVERLVRVMDVLVELDEVHHLTILDVKPGQWMARADGSFVLQDADDVVPSPWRGAMYENQVEGAVERMMRVNGVRSREEGWRIWRDEMFPNRTYTVRYAMVLLPEIVARDMGFSWGSSACRSGPPGFDACFRETVDWAATKEADWPAPAQVRAALVECAMSGRFSRTQFPRPPAAWRDLRR